MKRKKKRNHGIFKHALRAGDRVILTGKSHADEGRTGTIIGSRKTSKGVVDLKSGRFVPVDWNREIPVKVFGGGIDVWPKAWVRPVGGNPTDDIYNGWFISRKTGYFPGSGSMLWVAKKHGVSIRSNSRKGLTEMIDRRKNFSEKSFLGTNPRKRKRKNSTRRVSTKKVLAAWIRARSGRGSMNLSRAAMRRKSMKYLKKFSRTGRA